MVDTSRSFDVQRAEQILQIQKPGFDLDDHDGPATRVEREQIDPSTLSPFTEACLGLCQQAGPAEPSRHAFDHRGVFLVSEARELACASEQTELRAEPEDGRVSRQRRQRPHGPVLVAPDHRRRKACLHGDIALTPSASNAQHAEESAYGDGKHGFVIMADPALLARYQRFIGHLGEGCLSTLGRTRSVAPRGGTRDRHLSRTEA